MKPSYKILKKKQVKEILQIIKNQWGSTPSLDYVFLITPKNKLYIVNKEVFDIEFEKLNVNLLGYYFGEVIKNRLRLSIEGSQLVGPGANKNVQELTEDEVKFWMQGNDLKNPNNLRGFVLIKHKNDFLGCGNAVEDGILNYVTKIRRISG